MTDRDVDACMHVPGDAADSGGSEREGPRDTHARDARVIHEDDRSAQVEIRDAVSLHAGEVVDAVRAGWPFRGARPTGPELARFAARLFATRTRTVGTLLVVLSTALITLAAHAAA